uniref:Putative long-chain fatty-acid-CoA ligase protein n=1 Tax=uncultured bacterium lac193 TaxID=1447243 RepID=X2L8E4_9BACT|nr:putative long-chain fatty-acid-CoA ligase protein [uncultured bacterium lac193]
MLLQAYLERTADRTPDAEALVTEERRLTFRELDAEANSVAAALVEAGVLPRDRVAIHLDNRAETVVAIFAVLKAGAAFLMVNPSAKVQKLEYLLRHSEASAIVLPASKAAAAAESLAGIGSLKAVLTLGEGRIEVPGKRTLEFRSLALQSRAMPAVPTIDLDLAALLYTSGSTGEPKGVMLSHGNIRAATDSIAEYLRLTPQDVLMNVLPLSFGYGLTQLFTAIKVGARFVLEKGMTYPHVALTRMSVERVTGFAMVPTIASVVLGMDLTRYDLSTLRYVTNAGAGLPPEHVRRFRSALPHVDLVLMYGQTECLRISYLEPVQADQRPDSVGRGIPNQELMIIDPEGGPVPAGEIGELVVRGAHVTCGYWRMPTETAAALREGRYPGERVLHTGDLFRADTEGYLYFVSRRDDIIKSKGEKVSPREVENALYRLDGVSEAAVVGIAHPVLGQAVKAVIVLREGVQLTSREVQRHCAGCLEDFMVPAVVEFTDALPKSDNGKVLKASLRH